MAEYILVGCDLHDRDMVLRIAADKGPVEKRTIPNTGSGRKAMVRELKRRAEAAGGAKVVVAYEAGPHGFVLYDAVKAAGLDCRVVPPTHIPKSAKSARNKSDGRDSRVLLGLLRSWAFADEELPEVWVPDPALRDERELTRVRGDASRGLTRAKTRVQMLLKRYGLRKPESVGESWTKGHWAWLQSLTGARSALGPWTRKTLGHMLDRITWLEGEAKAIDQEVAELSRTARYAEPVRVATEDSGVGVLNQSVWMWIRTSPKARAFVDRLAAEHPKYGKQIAVVALMRRRAPVRAGARPAEGDVPWRCRGRTPRPPRRAEARRRKPVHRSGEAVGAGPCACPPS